MKLFTIAATIVCVVTAFTPLASQELPEDELAPGEGETVDPTPEDALSLFEQTILQDLETAENSELIDWAITLGLSARGSRREVEDRILEYYGFERNELISRQPDDPEDDPEDADEPDGTEDSETEPDPESALSVATIRQARGSEYFTIEQTDERYLRLIGGVELTMEDGDAVHTITAEELTLNLEKNTISATGAVEYLVQRPSETEEFRGDGIVFNIRDWDGVFLRGITDSGQASDPDQPDFAVSGARISRSPQEIVVIDDGVITSSVADPPNYRIRAQRIWILAPGEWGIRRAVLYVGRVPMFYFPYFFVPGDRLFFNPAIGARSREGSFIQTTTYIFGQSEEDDPPFSIMQIAESVDDREKEIQGLFLRVPDTPREIRRPEWTLKLMADVYTKLGYYGGAAGSLPGLGPFSQLDWRVGAGTSRNIYFDNGAYSSFYVDDMGRARRRWNHGYVLKRDVPVRYETELDAQLDVESASLTINYEMFSDTRFRSDYGDRAESIDWSGLITRQSRVEPEESVGEINSLRWNSQLRWRPSIPELRPWIASFNLSSLRTELRWKTRDNAELPAPVARAESNNSPETRFFYPDSAVLPDLVVELRGTLAELPSQRRPSEEDDDTEDDDHDTADIRPPWESPTAPAPPDEDGFRVPERAGDLRGIIAGDPGSLALTYTLRPALRVDRITDSDQWQTYEDVGFDWKYSTLQNRNRGNLGLQMISPADWVRYDGSLAAEQKYQSVTFLTDIEETERTRLEQSALAFRGSSVTHTSTTTGYPLKEIYVLENSTVRHQLISRVYERRFERIGLNGSPQYETRLGEWSEEGISAHTGNATLRWRLWNSEQSFAAETILPPLDRAYLGTLALVTGPLSSQFRGGYRKTEDDGWKPDPFAQTHRLEIVEDEFVLEQRLEYDLEETELTQARSIGRLWPLRLELQGQRTTGLDFSRDSGWRDTGEPRFRWTSLAVGLQAEPRFSFWRRRIDLGLTGILSFEA